jgi:hypothetical protein
MIIPSNIAWFAFMLSTSISADRHCHFSILRKNAAFAGLELAIVGHQPSNNAFGHLEI